jgi:hypothetical protein
MKQTPELLTRKCWELFSRFSDDELDYLLESEGIRPCNNRALKLQQCLTNWFHGFTPNLNLIPVLAAETGRKQERGQAIREAKEKLEKKSEKST